MKKPVQFAIILAGLVFLMSGCSLFQRAMSIVTPQGSVIGSKDAGKPATLDSNTKTDSITIPAGTTVSVTKEQAIPAIPKTDTSPGQEARPAREITTFTLPKDVKWEKAEYAMVANTGTPDVSIAKKKIEAAESRILLYVSISAMIAAGFFIYTRYPTPAYISGGASLVLFAAWKLSDLPDWFWVVGIVALAAAAFLYIGHERGLKTTQNGTP